MTEILNATPRVAKGTGAARSLRRNGQIPAVIYAHGEPARELQVSEKEFADLLNSIRGKAPLIDLRIADEPPLKCIIKQLQRDAVTLQLMHVDFQKIHAHEKITINIPIHLMGTPIGTKMGGLLDHALRELPVRALPGDLPANITLDITNLKVGQSLHVSDVKLEKVDIQLPPTTPIASVLAPRKVEEAAAGPAIPTPAAGEEPKEPEVIAEKKAAERAEERSKAEAEERGGKPKPEKKEEKKK